MIRLTDGQWERIRNYFPEENIPDGRPGRKPVSTRRVLEAVLWILNTGAQWHMLPQSYPNYKTVHRRFQTWCRDEVLRRVLTDVADELRDRGALDEGFSRTTSIAGIQVSNWILVIVAVVVLWIIYSFVAH